jgi:protease IV
MAIGGTLEKLGANMEGVSQGRFAGMNAPNRPYTTEEREKVGRHLQDFYDQFVEKAAAARDMTPAELDRFAQGRVWTGRQARELGLVDALGGLDRAVLLAKERAGIDAGEEVQLVFYPPRRTLYELLTQFYGTEGGELAGATVMLGVEDRRAVGALLAPLRLFQRGEPLALLPFTFVR